MDENLLIVGFMSKTAYLNILPTKFFETPLLLLSSNMEVFEPPLW